MKTLFIFSDTPLSQNYYAGGATRFTQAFQALICLGHEVHVLRLLSHTRRQAVIEFEANLSVEDKRNYDLAQSWQDLPFEYSGRFKTRFEGILKGLFSPLEFAFPEIHVLQQAFCTAIERTKPDFILAEMLPAGGVLAAIEPEIPWIYGHHDWRYRLRGNRLEKAGHRAIGSRFTQWALRRGEELLVRKSSAVITASATEAEEIRALRVKHCIPIPATYPSFPWPLPETSPQNMRIVHFGSLQSPQSLNTMPLMRYLEQVSPQLPKDWEFVIIGGTASASSALIESLRAAGAKLLGFVRDLSTAFRPFDVSIVPYEHNTGERTRVAQLFNYSQVVVTTESAVKGSSYLRSGYNCLAVASLAEFPATLKYLAEQPELRKQIGLAAKATFEKELTLQSQLPKFQHIIDVAVNGR